MTLSQGRESKRFQLDLNKFPSATIYEAASGLVFIFCDNCHELHSIHCNLEKLAKHGQTIRIYRVVNNFLRTVPRCICP